MLLKLLDFLFMCTNFRIILKIKLRESISIEFLPNLIHFIIHLLTQSKILSHIEKWIPIFLTASTFLFLLFFILLILLLLLLNTFITLWYFLCMFFLSVLRQCISRLQEHVWHVLAYFYFRFHLNIDCLFVILWIIS